MNPKNKVNKMSVKQAKDSQRYIAKPIFPTCSNCAFFKSDFIAGAYGYVEEKNIRCGHGNFKVNKNATCSLHRSNPSVNK